MGDCGQVGVSLGQVRRASLIITSTCINLPSQIVGSDEKGTQSGHGMGGGLFGDVESANL